MERKKSRRKKIKPQNWPSIDYMDTASNIRFLRRPSLPFPISLSYEMFSIPVMFFI